MRKRKLIYGVGINDADYRLYEKEKVDGKVRNRWICPFYIKWVSMLQRCYSQIFFLKYPSYRGCSVVNDWLYFSKFRTWMLEQEWEGKELDKDILFPGNKVYGPETCIFIDARVNTFLGEKRSSIKGDLIGVSFDRNSGKYKAECRCVVENKSKHLGLFIDIEEGHKAWLAFKLKQAYILAEQQTDERVAKALIDRYENYGNFTKAA